MLIDELLKRLSYVLREPEDKVRQSTLGFSAFDSHSQTEFFLQDSAF